LAIEAVAVSSVPATSLLMQSSMKTRATLTCVATSASLNFVFWRSARALTKDLTFAHVGEGCSERTFHPGD
jgi:hypothetical protein